MVKAEQEYRKLKEHEFEAQTSDIKDRIAAEIEPNGETTEDENTTLQEHYDKLKSQIEASKEQFA